MIALDKLNAEQREAVVSTEGPLLVLAGAGTGKTNMITHRIAYIIDKQLALPREILAITFTNKAAGEMRDRVKSMGVQDSENICIKTFHGFCSMILHRHAKTLNYKPNFTIYQPDDSKKILKAIYTSMKIKAGDKDIKKSLHDISIAKSQGWAPDEYAHHLSDKFPARIYRRYQDTLRKNNAMDFDDLILNTMLLFNDNPEILQKYQYFFKYILIDEYQDTDHSQYLIAKMLAGKRRNLCVCGDDDQSIYGWRGADVRNIGYFQKDFPEVKIVKLEKNYRSSPNILKAANKIIRNNTDRMDKHLISTIADNHKNVKFIIAEDEQEEACIVADAIEELLEQDPKRSYNDMAVLYRTNAQSRRFEKEFRKRKIPFNLVGSVEFFSRKEIKDILSYLDVVYDPQDNLAVERIINTPSRGIGKQTVIKLQDYADDIGGSLMDAIHQADWCTSIDMGKRMKIKEFNDIIKKIEAYSKTHTICELLQYVLTVTKYKDMLIGSVEEQDQERLQNIRELIEDAATFKNDTELPDLDAYLEGIALTSDADGTDDINNVVQLLTLHCAKGLEFPIVFMVGMAEGTLPLDRPNRPTPVEEERRLCYVGITRAKEQLFMIYPEQHFEAWEWRKTYVEPSRFLDEMTSVY